MRTIENMAAAALLTLLAGFTSTPPVRAGGIPVFDAAALSQTIIQVSNEATMLANQAAQIANEVNQLQNQTAMLQSIGPSQFADLNNALATQSQQLAAVLSAASKVQYTLANVQAQINQTFPQAGDWAQFDMRTVGQRVQQWDNAISEANSVAMQAQTSLGGVQTRNTQIQGLMAQAQAESGQVRQLQINAQLNGQIAQALNDNAAVTATLARAQMMEQQRAVAARELAREQHRRAMTNFADRGAPATVLNRLPRIVQP